MRFSPLKKKVKIYNNRQQIHLNKSDDYSDEYAYIRSPDDEQKLMNDINDLRNKNTALLNDNESKDTLINQLKDNQDAAINDFKTAFINDHQDRIDEYQSKIDDYQSKIKSKDDEINDLKAALSDVSTKYNMLRLAIAGTSRWTVLFNGHTNLLNQYPEHHLEYDNKSIMIESTDDTTDHKD